MHLYARLTLTHALAFLAGVGSPRAGGRSTCPSERGDVFVLALSGHRRAVIGWKSSRTTMPIVVRGQKTKDAKASPSSSQPGSRHAIPHMPFAFSGYMPDMYFVRLPSPAAASVSNADVRDGGAEMSPCR